MKKISRILFGSAQLFVVAFVGVSWSEDLPSLQDIYDKHQSEILTTLSGPTNSADKRYKLAFLTTGKE